MYAAWLWSTLSLVLCFVVIRFAAAVVAAKFPTTSWQTSPMDALRGGTAARVGH
jgi:hypothetical protein